MAMVSVNVDQLAEAIDALKMARADTDGSANYIRPILDEAGVHVPELSDWTGGEGVAWLTQTIAYLERRLEFAKRLLQTSVSRSGFRAAGLLCGTLVFQRLLM